MKPVSGESGWLNSCEKESSNLPKRRQLINLECGFLFSFFLMSLEPSLAFNHTLNILSASPILSNIPGFSAWPNFRKNTFVVFIDIAYN
jgi:hypothetical protein